MAVSEQGDIGTTVERTFAPDVATVGDARRFVEQTLSSWGADELAWTAMLLVTELTTNAVLHASTSYDVRLEQRGGGTIRIGVSDGSARKPRPRDYALDATTGRGLGLVESLAAAWGTSTRTNGKTVWADVHPDSASATTDEPDLDAFLLDDDLDLLTPRRENGNAEARITWASAA